MHDAVSCNHIKASGLQKEFTVLLNIRLATMQHFYPDYFFVATALKIYLLRFSQISNSNLNEFHSLILETDL